MSLVQKRQRNDRSNLIAYITSLKQLLGRPQQRVQIESKTLILSHNGEGARLYLNEINNTLLLLEKKNRRQQRYVRKLYQEPIGLIHKYTSASNGLAHGTTSYKRIIDMIRTQFFMKKRRSNDSNL